LGPLWLNTQGVLRRNREALLIRPNVGHLDALERLLLATGFSESREGLHLRLVVQVVRTEVLDAFDQRRDWRPRRPRRVWLVHHPARTGLVEQDRFDRGHAPLVLLPHHLGHFTDAVVPHQTRGVAKELVCRPGGHHRTAFGLEELLVLEEGDVLLNEVPALAYRRYSLLFLVRLEAGLGDSRRDHFGLQRLELMLDRTESGLVD